MTRSLSSRPGGISSQARVRSVDHTPEKDEDRRRDVES